MYTEDDEKVKVKKSNSNNDYNDFYDAFDNKESYEEKKSTKNKKKSASPKKEKKEEVEETEYSYFYNNDNDDEFPQTDRKNLKKIIIICGIAILAIALVVVCVLLIKKASKEDIELLNDNIAIKVGDSDYISYKIVNNEVNNISGFISSDEAIATVDENGMVTGISGGEVTISFTYTVNGRTKTKHCKVNVEGAVIGDEITMNILFSSGANDTWTNDDVMLNIETIGHVTSIKYAINCSDECSYNDVVDKQIPIAHDGITNVKVVATGRNNNEVVKDVIVKIDKEKPKATLVGNRNISANNSVEVCATCSDSVSGCVKDKVCTKYTSSKSNQVITVTDNAGNTSVSSTFNVTINVLKDPCTLSVSPDGVVSASLREEATYYGFNSSYSGVNELSKKIDIPIANKNGDQIATNIYYFVKNKNGSGGKCYITVIKTCSYTDKTSTSPNCPVTCTFSKSS